MKQDWRVILFGITSSYATLWIDCDPLSNELDEIKVPLKSRREFEGGKGFITMAKMLKSSSTMPIDLQWAVFNCDPNYPFKRKCAMSTKQHGNLFDFGIIDEKMQGNNNFIKS